PVVNLAARLVGTAGPRQIVLDAEVARRAGPDRVVALGPRTLDGFDHPVEVYTTRLWPHPLRPTRLRPRLCPFLRQTQVFAPTRVSPGAGTRSPTDRGAPRR